MREYFCVHAKKYDGTKSFDIVRPASLNNPKDNAVMFIIESRIGQADCFRKVKNCLIFWPQEHSVPADIAKVNAVISCSDPHGEYCCFFRDNKITYIPKKEKFTVVDGAYIAENASIGKNCTVMPGAYIGGEVCIGDNVYIGCGVKLVGEIYIGNNVIIRENTVLGADGLSDDRETDGRAITMPQFGKIVIEDDVQIGANSTIARAAIDETRICRGAKLDSGMFISHNCRIGEDTFMVGETIMFGSSSIGKRCLISGNTTIMNLVEVGDGSLVGAGAVVTKSVAPGTVVLGNPARPRGEKK